MNAETTKASIAVELMRIAEEREQFIRQCIELYSSNTQKGESEQVIAGRTTFPDGTTHEPHAAKPDEHVSKALGVTAEIETAPRSLVTSASDDLRGAMARGEEPPERPSFVHRAAGPKNGRVAGRLLFGLITMVCLIAPIDTSGIAVLSVAGQSADYPTSAPFAAAPSAADAQAVIETEPAGASTPAPMQSGPVTDANVAAQPELIVQLFEEFRQRYLSHDLSHAGAAVAHAPVKLNATPRSAPKPPVARRVSVAAKPPAHPSRSIGSVAASVDPSYVPADRAGGQEQPPALLPRYLTPYPPSPSPFGFPVGGPIYAPRPAGHWVPRAVIGYPTPLQNTGTQPYDMPVQRIPLAGSYISHY